MLATLALVVFLGSILIFFSDEFIKFFKKLSAVKGAKLFIPLFIASWFVSHYEFWVLLGMLYLRERLGYISNFLVQIMPFQLGSRFVVLIILLVFLSVVPVCVMDFLSRRKNYRGYKYPFVTSAILWIMCVVLLLAI
jgi:hypothetical protein